MEPSLSCNWNKRDSAMQRSRSRLAHHVLVVAMYLMLVLHRSVGYSTVDPYIHVKEGLDKRKHHELHSYLGTWIHEARFFTSIIHHPSAVNPRTHAHPNYCT